MEKLLRVSLRLSLCVAVIVHGIETRVSPSDTVDSDSEPGRRFQGVLDYDGSGKSMIRGSKRCGAIIKCSSEVDDEDTSVNNIFYNPPAPLISNERCIWVIAAPKATRYDIRALSLGSAGQVNDEIPGSETSKVGLLVAGASYDDDKLTAFTGMTAKGNTAVLHANIIVVTIWTSKTSKDTIGKGVVLHFRAFSETGGKVSPSSLHSIHGFINVGSTIQHPMSWSTERPGGVDSSKKVKELSTYVLIPKRSTGNVARPFGVMGVAYKKTTRTPESACLHQTTRFYGLDVLGGNATSAKWLNLITLCDHSKLYHLEALDAVLIIVKSSRQQNDRARSFSVTYTEEQESIM